MTPVKNKAQFSFLPRCSSVSPHRWLILSLFLCAAEATADITVHPDKPISPPLVGFGAAAKSLSLLQTQHAPSERAKRQGLRAKGNRSRPPARAHLLSQPLVLSHRHHRARRRRRFNRPKIVHPHDRARPARRRNRQSHSLVRPLLPPQEKPARPARHVRNYRPPVRPNPSRPDRPAQAHRRSLRHHPKRSERHRGQRPPFQARSSRI